MDCYRREYGAGHPGGQLLLPTAAERPVELHQALILGSTRLRQYKFRIKQRPLAVENFQVRGRPALVPQDGKPHRLLQVRDGILLPHPHLMEFLIGDQRIGYVAKRALNRLFVSDQRLLVLRFRQL